jgi:hypothetical protein
MEAHVEACPACRRRCDALKNNLALCRTTPSIEAPAEVADAIRSALRDLGASSR